MKILVIFLLSIPALGACIGSPNCTVKTSGGNYNNIANCVSAMANGDSCTVFAGVATSGTITIPAGGVGAYRTLQVNTGDTVTINGTVVINSHTKVIGFRIVPSVSTTTACVSISSSATDWFVTSNFMQACGGITEQINSATSTFGYIQGNTIAYPCGTPSVPKDCEAMYINGDHHLIENNDISHVSDGLTLFGAFNVVRNNLQHDNDEAECNAGGNGGNCHIDFIESEPGTHRPATYNLYEGNGDINCKGGDCHMFLAQGDSCTGCGWLTIRFNHLYTLGGTVSGDAGGPFLLNDVGSFPHVKSYNNTIVRDMWPGGGLADVYAMLSTNTFGAIKNDILVDSNPNGGDWFYITATTGFAHGHNLAYITPGANGCASLPCSFPNHTNTPGQTTPPVGNIVNQDPKFVNYSSDWHLQNGSPAIGAGSFLTTVASGCNTSSLTLADADYFQDGKGLTAVGVQPDWIRVGASTTAQITSVNYTTNVVTFAASVSCTNGDGVYLYKDSSGHVVLAAANPDLGAFPSIAGGQPLAPTNLTVIVH